MNLDIRLPIGMLFTSLGLVLTAYGLTADASIYQRSLGHNVNLVWGVVLIVFGAVRLALGRRGRSTVRRAEASAEGRATEEREHRTGLEREPPRGH